MDQLYQYDTMHMVYIYRYVYLYYTYMNMYVGMSECMWENTRAETYGILTLQFPTISQ